MNWWKKTVFWLATISFVFGVSWCVIYNQVFGGIPEVTKLWVLPIIPGVTEKDWIWQLPFPVSHAWDAVFVLPLALTIFLLEKRGRDTAEKTRRMDVLHGLTNGYFLGCVMGLVCLMILTIFGLIPSLFVGSVFCLLFCLIGLYHPDYCNSDVAVINFAASYSLTFSLVVGLFWTMPVGAVMGLIVVIPSILIILVLTTVASACQVLVWPQLCPEDDEGWE